MKSPADNESAPKADESPNLPGFRTWRGVYWFVIGCFVFYVVLLIVLSQAFS